MIIDKICIMAQIVMLDSTKEDLFVCGYCKTIFNSLTLFLDHKREPCSRDAFSDETSFSNLVGTPVQPASSIDPACSYRPPLPVDQTPESSPCKSLNVNIKEVSCKFCGKTFKRSKSLSSHLRSHSGKPYQCLICGKCFAQSSHLKRHESTHRIWPTSLCETTAKTLQADTSSYSCMFCDTILSSYGQFRIHLKKHGSLKQFKCVQQECHNLFGTMDLLLQHVASVHSQAKYFCPLCNKDFSTLEESAMHQQNHVSPSKTIVETNQFKCSHCDAVFKKKEKLELHIVSENHSKSCVYCGKTFTSHKRLRLHLQIHKNSKPFQCNVCSQSFSLKKYLMSHMLRHSERAFACNMCNYKFKRKDLLQRHMKTHQKKKMLKCPFKEALGCSMEFTRSDKLKLHVKNHTKQMTVNPKRSRRSKESSSTIEIMIVPLDSHKGEGDTDT